MEAEQTSVVVGSPRAKQIGLELKIGDRCICKVRKQLDGAKKIKREGEDYSTYINLFHYSLEGGGGFWEGGREIFNQC